MLFKKNEQYLILCLLIQITLDVGYVSGKPSSIEVTNTISDLQLDFLVDQVCGSLTFEGVDYNSCNQSISKSQFPSSSESSSSEEISRAKPRCITKEFVRFQIEPSQRFQIVVLVPEPTHRAEIDKYAINFGIVDPKKEYEDVSTFGDRYTLWSAELDPGKPISWQGGYLVAPYKERPQKGYDIKYHLFEGNEGNNKSLTVNGLFTWNTHGDDDICFDVRNTCNSSQIISKIWPDSKPELSIANMTVNNHCEFQVTGLYGSSRLKYVIPPGENYSDCILRVTEPEIPKGVWVEAIEETSTTWEVYVNWTETHCAVDKYNVTLYIGNDTWVQEVAAGKNTAVFKGVVGEGLYAVAVEGILKLTNSTLIATNSSRSIFPAHPLPSQSAGGAALGALGGAAAALALVLLWRRLRRTKPHDYLPKEEPLKKSDIEAISVKLETEDSWEVGYDKLLLHEVIGEGAFGVVRRATFVPNGSTVAVKMLKDFPSLEEVRAFRSEMELMKSVGVHPHIVSLVGVCSGRRPLIVAEYCSRGDLLTYLRCTWDVMVSKRNAKYYNNNIEPLDYRNDIFKQKLQMENSKLVVNKLYELQQICDKELTSLDLLSFCRQIAMGMEFLSANRVVHRDLAARNVLVTADRTLKIADFGLSRDVYEENQYKQKGNGKMPVKWMAIESLTRRVYTTQSDVWSFGVVVWEVATMGASPYACVPAARLTRLLRAGYRMPRPANCGPQLYEIMESCWRTHPRDRPTFAELHGRLDELLNSACADQYLSLEVDPSDAPPTPKHHRYIRMLISRGTRSWSREGYERPIKPKQSNRYTSSPVVLTKSPPQLPSI